MQVKDNDDDHQQKIDQADRYEVFPFERQDLVDAQAREGPLDPHQQQDHEEGLAEEPDEARDVVHHRVEALPAGNVQRHPTAEKDRGRNTRDDEQIDELGDVEQAEVHARVLGMVSGREFRLGLREVERTAVHLGVAGDQVDHEGDERREVALEDEPPVGLTLDDLRELHRVGQDDDRQDREADRQLVGDHLRTASHGADERILVVGAPPSQQDAHHADRRSSHHEEDTHVEVEDLHPAVEGQAGESQKRGQDDDVGGQVVKELVRMADGDDLLGEHLEDVAEDLQRAPRTDAHGAQTALERGTDLALHEDHHDGDDRVEQQQTAADHHALDEGRQAERQERRQESVYPVGYDAEIEHILVFCV